MILGVCHTKLQAFEINTAAKRKTGSMRRTGSIHFVGSAEVVPQANIELVRYKSFGSEYEMVYENTSSLYLVAGCEVIVGSPSRQVDHCDRNADRGMTQ